MKVNGTSYRSIWRDRNTNEVKVIDQRWLPHDFRIATLETLEEFSTAIREMCVRGAPLIGITAVYGMAKQMARDPSDTSVEESSTLLKATRPTGVNLRWALDRCENTLMPLDPDQRAAAALQLADQMADEDSETNRLVGVHGLEIIRRFAEKKADGEPVRILTHCNAGWIGGVDYGSAISPIYQAHDEGIPVHVWVDETRPRNQGALTCWELAGHGISHQYVADNAGGHLMQNGLVDFVIVGTDRTTSGGDVCNKIGTYLKALAAKDNNIPFYVALPSSTIDWAVDDGLAEIPIEERKEREVTHIWGKNGEGSIVEVQVTPDDTQACNPAFDVTPRRLIAGLITERGITEASPEGLAALFPELRGE